MRPRLASLAIPILASAAFASHDARGCLPRSADYTIEILVDGRPVPVLAARGASYVEASQGREYAIRVTNRTGRRVAAALAVDGLNVIDARRTSARAARKWILDPWQSITLDGWQVSSGTARRFVFTTEEASYGAWLGRTGDLGVISAAFFRERIPEPPPQPLTKQRAEEGAAAPRADAESSRARDYAATGIGREVDHPVVEVAFDAEASPASVVTLRYEYRDALVRLGVLPDDGPLARRGRATGFTDSGFAPDPYRH